MGRKKGEGACRPLVSQLPETGCPPLGPGPASCLHSDPGFPAASQLLSSGLLAVMESLREWPPPPPRLLHTHWLGWLCAFPSLGGRHPGDFNALKCLKGTFRFPQSDKPSPQEVLRSWPCHVTRPSSAFPAIPWEIEWEGGFGACAQPSENRSSRQVFLCKPGGSTGRVRGPRGSCQRCPGVRLCVVMLRLSCARHTSGC